MPLLNGGGFFLPFFPKSPKFYLFGRFFHFPTAAYFKQNLGGNVEELFNVKELAAHLKCTEQTVRRYVMAKKIPYHKIDRMVRFIPAEIEAWVKNGKKMRAAEKTEGGER